jgi:hypothetical protein
VGYEGYIIATMLDVFLQEANVGSFIPERIEKLEHVSYEKWNQFFFSGWMRISNKEKIEMNTWETEPTAGHFTSQTGLKVIPLIIRFDFAAGIVSASPAFNSPVFRGDGLLTMFYYPIFVS